MGDIPVDARRVVNDLRTSRTKGAGLAPRSWTPPQSLEAPPLRSAQQNEHLGWMHKNWDLRPLIGPPRDHGWKGRLKRLVHRLVTATFAPYLERLQDYLGVNARALQEVASRVDELEAAQAALMAAVRADFVDLARHLEDRMGD
jgi:hypothetical protein